MASDAEQGQLQPAPESFLPKGLVEDISRDGINSGRRSLLQGAFAAATAAIAAYEQTLVAQPVELSIDGSTVLLDPALVGLAIDEGKPRRGRELGWQALRATTRRLSPCIRKMNEHDL